MDAENFEWQKEVAYGLHNLAVMDQKRGRPEAAERSIQAEIALFQGWLEQNPGSTELRFEAADSISWMGSLAVAQGRLVDAEPYFNRQLQMLSANMSAEPDNSNWKIYSVYALNLLTDVQKLQGKHGDAIASAQSAIKLASPLLAHPANNEWRATPARSYLNRAEILANQNTESALDDAERAEALLLTTVEAEAKSERFIDGLVRAHNQIARLALLRSDLEKAHSKLQASQTLMKQAWQDTPTETLRIRLAETRLLQGDLASRTGEKLAANTHWADVRELLADGNIETIPFARLDPLLRAQLALGDADGSKRSGKRLASAGYSPPHPFPLDTAMAAR